MKLTLPNRGKKCSTDSGVGNRDLYPLEYPPCMEYEKHAVHSFSCIEWGLGLGGSFYGGLERGGGRKERRSEFGRGRRKGGKEGKGGVGEKEVGKVREG